MNIEIKYIENTNFLNKKEWEDMIHFLLKKINDTLIGNLLIEDLKTHLINNKLTICNYSSVKSFQYPHYDYLKNIIYIPETPYFINVPVLPKEFKVFKSEVLINNIFNSKPLSDKIDHDFVNCFARYKFQPYYVILFHELVHCLRHLRYINSNHEEESTIYGIKDNTLIINEKIITENSFRKEVGLLPRLSHDSKDKYIYKITEKKVDTKTLKEMFFLLR